MNNVFEPTEPSDDALAAALRTLPEPPEHRADFWSSLEAELATTESGQGLTGNERPRRNGRAQFLLVAAALVLVAGVIGVIATNRPDDGVTVADNPAVDDNPTVDDAPVETVPPPESDLPEGDTAPPDNDTADEAVDQPGPGDRPSVNTDGRTLVGVVDGFLVDELFGYDLVLPDGFTVEFPTTYGSYATLTADPTAASIQTWNSFADEDEPTIEPIGDETVAGTTTVEVPLYESINDSVERSEATATATEYVFDRGADGQRTTRVIEIDERVIVIEVIVRDPASLPGGAGAVFDGFRIYEGPIAKGDACSTLDAPALSTPTELNPAQAARFDAIVTALTTCDWNLLGAQVNPIEFTASIGGGEAIELWTRQERYGDQILRTLYDHLAFPVGIDEAGEAQWPRGWASIDGFDTETLTALEASEYYSEPGLSESEIGFFGYRTGIDADGNWNYFLVGD